MRVEITKHGKIYEPKDETIKIRCPDCKEVTKYIKVSEFAKAKEINIICKKCECEFIAKYK